MISLFEIRLRGATEMPQGFSVGGNQITVNVSPVGVTIHSTNYRPGA
jgi:hypothetical protein